MSSKLVRFIVFFAACAMALRDWTEVLIKNVINTDDSLEYILSASVKVGAVALIIVGVGIFLKRNIWAYLFLLVLIASFFPVLAFSNVIIEFHIGSLKLDLIAIPLLVIHIFLNIHLFRFPELSKKEEEESANEKVDYFLKRFESKSDDEMLRMDEGDLLPEAIEARKILLTKRGL